MTDLKQKSFKALGWDFLGKIGNQSIGFIISIILARLLSPEDFGLLAMVTVVIGLSNIFTDVGLGSALIQRKDVRDEHYGSVFYFNIIVGLTLALTLFLSAGYIASFYNRPIVKPLAQVMSVTFVISSFCNVQRLWLYKNINYKIPTQSSLLGLVSGGIVGVAMAFKGFGVWSLVAQTIVSGITSNLYIFFATKWKPKLIFKLKALKELWTYGFNLFLSSLLETFSNQVDKLIIGKLFSPTTLGYYFRAKSLDSLVVTYSSGSLISVMFPVMSNIQDDEERLKSIIFRTFHLLSFVTFLLLGILFLCARDIIIILFSAKWLPSVGYYKILVLAGFIYPFSALLVNILLAKGNSKAFLHLEILKKIPIFLNFVIGFWFGIRGFLIGFVICYYVSLILNIFFAAKELKVTIVWFYKIFWKYLVIWVLLIAILYYLDNYCPIRNTLIHLISFATGFTILYLIVSSVFQFEGFVLARNELITRVFKKKD